MHIRYKCTVVLCRRLKYADEANASECVKMFCDVAEDGDIGGEEATEAFNPENQTESQTRGSKRDVMSK